jgi:hypothetical protein
MIVIQNLKYETLNQRWDHYNVPISRGLVIVQTTPPPIDEHALAGEQEGQLGYVRPNERKYSIG